ncbi:MAG: type II secretion system F family protein [Kineosporiaceae bacterium]
MIASGGGPWALPALGALLGGVFACGLLLVVLRRPSARRVDLVDRVAPYVRGATPSRLLRRPSREGWLPGLERGVAPLASSLTGVLERLTGSAVAAQRRLDQLGSTASVADFRARQVIAGAAGGVGGAALGLFLVTARGAAVGVFLVALVLGAVAAVLGVDLELTRRVRARQRRILTQLPAVAELLALSVAAGEGAAGALDRVSRVGRGELSGELRRAMTEVRAGASLVQALDGLARRVPVPGLVRFVDGVVISVERGTPLAEVLRAQAMDVQQAARRDLMELGGKKEVLMMVPVVFLILPVTVAFIVYPGLAALSWGP